MYRLLRLSNLFGLLIVSILISLLPAVAASAQSDVNNFSIKDFRIDYLLGRDSQNRSTLSTVEQITAIFPASDQNHGLERAIPMSYDGHSTRLTIMSVTDGQDEPLEYTTYEASGNKVLRIGNADTYVHGPHTYKIVYTQQDVTRYFTDTRSDEFYWDANGTEWAVPVELLTVSLHIDSGLRPRLSDSQSCYQGVSGSTSPCKLTATKDGFTAAAPNLKPYENLSLAVGFQPGTFAGYQTSLAEKAIMAWIVLAILTVPIAIVSTIVFIVRYHRRSNRSAEMYTVIPEYIPPKNISVSTAATISYKLQRSFSAQLIDFAVRHYIKIYQTRDKSFLRPAQYEIEIIKDTSDLSPEEQEIFRDLFDNPLVGARIDLSKLKNNTAVGLSFMDNQKKIDANIAGIYGLRKRDSAQSAWFKRKATWILVTAVLTLSPWLLTAAIIGYICGYVLKPLTDKGLALARYLKGLELYIKTAETDRLRMLQSPEGAARLDAPTDTNDKRQLIKLYERVLPYAILFGHEKDWNKNLGQYYQDANQAPSWYAGNTTAFNAAAFSSTMSSFTSTANYSAAASSSSGGSRGGGSSGGGGGGGGGGGW